MSNSFSKHSLRKCSAALLFAIALAVVFGPMNVEPAIAGPYVNLGVVESLAVEPYPTVALQVFNSAGSSMGPQDNNFFIDTGSNFVIVVGNEVPAHDPLQQLIAAGYQTVANYQAPGSNGNVATRVSQAYRVEATDTAGTRISLNPVRLLSTDDPASSVMGSRLGMPGLVGRNTTIDFLGAVNAFDAWHVAFNQNSFPSAPHRYHLPIELVELPLAGQQNATDPLPTSAPLPVVEAKLHFGGRTRTGRFLIDTTKTLTSISQDFAFEMGFDTNGNGSLADETEELGALPINRLGGVTDMPVLIGDRIRLLTDEGVDLIWDGMAVGIYEPPAGIDGILGFELFTSGWADRVVGGPNADDGLISQMHFDLKAADTGFGQLILDVNPLLDQVVSPPAYQNDDNPFDVNGDGDVTALDVLVVVNYINNTSTTDLPIPGPGEVVPPPFVDVSGDNFVSALDVLRTINFINSTGGSQTGFASLSAQGMIAVPEPASGLLAAIASAFAALGVAARHVRRRPAG